MFSAIILTAIIITVLFISLRLVRGMSDEDYEDVIERTVELDFQDSLNRMDGYNDDVIMDEFEAKWNGYIPKKKLHYYIGRLIEAQTSFLGIGS